MLKTLLEIINSIFCIPNEPNLFLITVSVGLITFSIPFLWNVYQNIFDKKKNISGDKIENILAKEFYQKALNSFTIFLQYPVGFAVFLGLFIVPWLPVMIGLIISSIVFLYFLHLPQIFQKIEDKSSTSLKQFLLDKDAETSDVLKAFKELWQKKDEDIEREFSLKPDLIFELFSQKINQLLKNEKLFTIRDYFNDFLVFINRRSIYFLGFSKGTLPKILEWHFEIWEKEYKLMGEENKLNERSRYSELSNILDSILRNIEERLFKEGGVSSFFDSFKEHAEKYKKNHVVSKDKRTEYYYIESLFNVFYQVFFGIIDSLPEKHAIWEHYFPKEWKVTKSNLDNKENIVSRVSWHEFLRWARERIRRTERKFDKDLDDVASNLFPEVDPETWEIILIFVFSGVQSVIEQPWNFGLERIVHFYRLPEEGEEEFFKRVDEKERQEKIKEINNTFVLADYLFKSVFSKENLPVFSKEKLDEYLKALKQLEDKYSKMPEEEYKRLKLLDIFTKMLEFKGYKGT